MSNLKQTSKIVKSILTDDKRTRNSDSFLYLKVLQHYAELTGKPVQEMSVQDFLLNMGNLGVPPFETVRRSRQLAQRKHPELSANETVTQMRREEECAYYAFSLGDVE